MQQVEQHQCFIGGHRYGHVSGVGHATHHAEAKRR
jgi:hypothetical protein